MAVTGGIAEGKSTVLHWLREDGFSVCSSDETARSLMAEERVRHKVADLAELPHDFTGPALRAAMLGDPDIRRRVNRFLHPLIGEANRAVEANFFEVPLLIEACLYDDYDQVWVVTCGIEEQRRRLQIRYGDESLIQSLLGAQLKTDTKCQFADVIVRTNAGEEYVRQALRYTVSVLKLTFLCSR